MSLAVVEGVGAGEGLRRPGYLVFCDVDETLINCKSMFEFLRFQLGRRHGAEGEERYRRVSAELRGQSAGGAPRESVNRAYYRAYAGESVAEMTALGQEWFALASVDPGFFIRDTLVELERHRAAGADIALVSGSFLPCLGPVAERVGADHVLCTSPVVENGRYTGEVTRPVIGEGKRAVALRMLADHAWISPQDCFAYGDHPSDFPLLDCVGNPRGVGDDPAVRTYLARRREQEPRRTREREREQERVGRGGSGCSLACWSMGHDEFSRACSGNCDLPLD